ncbi:MAG: hypothetical protein IJS90_02455 [Clostridia bacterium]|nr:hypothetical protein [Clostridia bacterium]
MPDTPNDAGRAVAENTTANRITEAVCVDTARVYDSCADKDCIPDLIVSFTETDQAIIDAASTVRCRSCEVTNVFSEIEKVPFSSGYYSVDATFYFRVGLDAYSTATAQPQTVYGLGVYSKKAILYGAEGSVKVFSSEYSPSIDTQNTMVTTNPRAKIQVATPICLDARLVTAEPNGGNTPEVNVNALPSSVKALYNGEFAVRATPPYVTVTIGLFSIIQIERDVQILIPAYDFCMPSKECTNDTEDPCDAFRRINFPVAEFFPPEQSAVSDSQNSIPPFSGRCCGCGRV